MRSRWVYRRSDGRVLYGGAYDALPPLIVPSVDEQGRDILLPDFVRYGVVEADEPPRAEGVNILAVVENGALRAMTAPEVAAAFPPPRKTRLSRADVIGLLTPAEWAEMNRYRPTAEAPYDDAQVFWAVSVFREAEYIDLADPRVAQIFGMLQAKNIVTPQRAQSLLASMAAAAAAKVV